MIVLVAIVLAGILIGAIIVVFIGPDNSVAEPSITVTSPEQGRAYAAGSTLNIQWNIMGDTGDTYTIECGRESALSRDVIYSSASYFISFYWDIPSWMPPGTDYHIWVTSNSNTSVNGDSGAFAITSLEDAAIQAGQFVNYTVQSTITNGTGSHLNTGWLRYVVKSVSATNITYNITQSGPDIGRPDRNSWEIQIWDSSALFGLNEVGFITTSLGNESLSTNWGIMECHRYNLTYDNEFGTGYGDKWVYCNVLMKLDYTEIDSTGTYRLHTILTLADTNLPRIID